MKIEGLNEIESQIKQKNDQIAKVQTPVGRTPVSEYGISPTKTSTSITDGNSVKISNRQRIHTRTKWNRMGNGLGCPTSRK